MKYYYRKVKGSSKKVRCKMPSGKKRGGGARKTGGVKTLL
jgi:hypothetical protein